MKAEDIYTTSDGDKTKAYYAELKAMGPIGEVALNLFRAQKCSARAKAYRKRGWTADAYERKNYSIEQLADILERHGSQLGIIYGWKEDKNIVFGGNEEEDPQSSFIFYVDLPAIGQVSFHTRQRGKGPDYAGEWDRSRNSQIRILNFCNFVFGSKPLEVSRDF